MDSSEEGCQRSTVVEETRHCPMSQT